MAERVEVRRAARVERARARQVLPGLAWGNAWREVDERREVPPVQRQFLDRALLDHGADFRGIGAEEWRRCDDGGCFLQPPDLERDVDARALIHLQDDAVAHPFLE